MSTRSVDSIFHIYLEVTRGSSDASKGSPEWTIIVQEERTFNKYVKAIDEKSFSSLAGQGHQFFNGMQAITIIQRIIPSPDGLVLNEEKMECESDGQVGKEGKALCSIRKETDTAVVISFSVSVDVAGITISDTLFVRCVLVEEKDEIRRIKRLEAELASTRSQLVACMALARRSEIVRMYTDTIAIFGSQVIPPFLYDFSKKVFAAELDGNPYIFDVIEPDRIRYGKRDVRVGPIKGVSTCPYWLRSVVCIVQTKWTHWRHAHLINCRRLVVNTTMEHKSQPGAADRIELNTDGISQPRSGGDIRISLHSNTRSVVIISGMYGSTGEYLPSVVPAQLASASEGKEIILPECSKSEVISKKIMINARFLNTTQRLLEAPEVYEADGLRKYFEEARGSTEGIEVPEWL